MSEWQNKSDTSINIAVANTIYRNIASGECYFVFDYCGNPSFSLPIIIENNIVLEPRKGKKSLAYIKGDAPHEDDNVLRAAMIAYLEMNGVKP